MRAIREIREALIAVAFCAAISAVVAIAITVLL